MAKRARPDEPRPWSSHTTNEKNSNDRFQNLVDWVCAHGGSFNDSAVAICTDRDLGFHIRAKCDLPEDTLLFSIPPSLMITFDSVKASRLGRAIMDSLPGLVDHVVAIDKEHARIENLSGEELLRDIIASRARAEAPIKDDNKGAEKAGAGLLMSLTDRSLFVAFLAHARFGADVMTSNGGQDKESSDFAPFVSSFPEEFPLPLLWCEADLAPLARCILGHTALRSVAALTSVLADDFRALRALAAGPRHAAARTLLDPVFFTAPPDMPHRGFARFLWASAALSSRTFADVAAMRGGAQSGGGGVSTSISAAAAGLGVMVPVLDMLNADVEAAQVEWRDVPGKGPQAILRKPVKADQEIFTHYGHTRGNDDLLVNYGFVQWNNGNDELRLGFVLADAEDLLPTADEDAEEGRLPAKRLEALGSALGASFGGKASGGLLRALTDGAPLEIVLSHAGPVPRSLRALAHALVQGRGNTHKEKSRGDEEAPIHLSEAIKAEEYIREFLTKKLDKLMAHLYAVAFPTRLEITAVSGCEEAPTRKALIHSWGIRSHELQGKDSSVEVGDNSYALSPTACAHALFDSQLGVLQHGLHACESELQQHTPDQKGLAAHADVDG